MKYIINAFRGFCMALADSVPGVSGGTVAFILGFYDKFINSLNDIIYGDKSEKIEAFKFLFKIAIGWGIGLILASLILANLFEVKIYEISSLFLGFIIFSLPLIFKEEKKNLKISFFHIIFLIIGILFVALITYFNPVSGGSYVDITNLNLGLALYLFVAGMISISAMVLPGISGSTILLIFGLYLPIVTGIKELIHFDFNYLLPLIIFGLGVITGVCVVIKLIKVCLEKYRSQSIYLIIGLMIGSLYTIVMGPTTLKNPLDALNFHNFNILFFAIGGLIIVGLEFLKRYLEKRKIEE